MTQAIHHKESEPRAVRPWRFESGAVSLRGQVRLAPTVRLPKGIPTPIAAPPAAPPAPGPARQARRGLGAIDAAGVAQAESIDSATTAENRLLGRRA